ncbi:MAG: hypothetical protein QNL28_00155 [Flavobacteriaceae bacterium]
MFFSCSKPSQYKSLQVSVTENIPGAPITLGIPFHKYELYDISKVRLFDSRGKEFVCQVTEVANWKPDQKSVKWITSCYITGNHRALDVTNMI